MSERLRKNVNEILHFLNQNAGVLSLIFSGVVTISTVVYAILTAKLVSETRKIREVQTEPKIQITLKPFEFAISCIRLHIKNIGFGLAKNIIFNSKVISGGEGAEKLLVEFTESN